MNAPSKIDRLRLQRQRVSEAIAFLTPASKYLWDTRLASGYSTEAAIGHLEDALAHLEQEIREAAAEELSKPPTKTKEQV